jgi:beta-galactosidase
MPCEVEYDDSSWRSLSVPHDFVVEGTFDPSLDPSKAALATNVSWYRKTFTLDQEFQNKLLWLTFDGVFRAADVYINGVFVAHHEEGYTSFPVYIHNASAPLNFGGAKENVLAVFVDSTLHELWAFEGGGIFRHVWLESASQVSVTPWGFAVTSVINGRFFGTDPTAAQTTDSALLLPRVDIQNAGSSTINGMILFELADPEGTIVANYTMPFDLGPKGWSRVAIGQPWGSRAKAKQEVQAIPFGGAHPSEHVQLWNTANRPPLYTATVSLLATTSASPFASGATVLDTVSTRIGIRSAVFDPQQGFVLNGAKVRIRGACNHVGFGGVGAAVPDRVAEFQVATLKAMGANAWRTAHNPVAPELIRYCDEYGE